MNSRSRKRFVSSRGKPDSEITLISLGPESFKEVLKNGLAMGADKAIHLIDPAFEGLDNLAVAEALANAIKTFSFDLILCGRQAVDDDMAQVGPALAVFAQYSFCLGCYRVDIF